MQTQDLSYLIRESQHRLMIDIMKPLILDIMQHNYGYLPPQDQIVPSNWLPDHQKWTWGDPSDSSGVRYVEFMFDHTQLGWQDGSDYNYGTPVVISDTNQIKPDLTYLVDNKKGVSDLQGELDESVTYLHSRTVTTSEQWHFDFGMNQKVTLGGKDAGIGFEAGANEAFGWKKDTSQQEADSKNVTRTQKLSYKVPVGKAELATLSSPTIVTRTPLHLNAWWTMPFTITVHRLWAEAAWKTVLGPRTYSSGQYVTTRWLGWQDFHEWMNATNTEFPGHTSPWNPQTRFNPAWSQLPQGGYTLLSMDGTVESSEQHATDWTFTDVTNEDPNKLDVPDGHRIYA